MSRFDLRLFEALKPKGAKMEIVEFTGSKTGDRVHLRFLFPLKAEWMSEITDHGENEREAYFVDEGRILPPGIRYWKHRHVVEKVTDQESNIIDDIEFRSSNVIFTLFLYPALYFSFLQRKPIYRKYFK